MILNWGQHRGHLAMLGRWREGRVCYWYLVSRSQPCCQISFYMAQDSPPQLRIMCPKMSLVLWLRNPGLILTLFSSVYNSVLCPDLPVFCLNFLEFLLLPLLSSYLLRSLLFWSCWFYIWCLHLSLLTFSFFEGPLSIAFWMGYIIFSRLHMSENVVSIPLLYKVFGWAQNSPPEIIFSQNFKNIGSLSFFFSSLSVAVGISDV